tara:strand:+ start:1363 stop:2517 length:1155 start_codon:yes stop_codon:yes gene_type:complete
MNIKPYVGNQYGLQFPVFSDGYVEVSYSDNIYSDTTSGQNLGIWEHKGSFSAEVLFTPYDINGYGSDVATTNGVNVNNHMGNQLSKKTMPSRSALVTGTATVDLDYMSVANRLKHRMALISSTNFNLYLINTTSINVNQPAEYRLEAHLTKGGVTNIVQSQTIITATDKHISYHDNPLYYLYKQNQAFLFDTGKTIAATPSATTIHVAAPSGAHKFYPRQKLYREDGELLGEIKTVAEVEAGLSGSNPDAVLITFVNDTNSAGSYTLANSRIYIEVAKEATYMKSAMHVGYTFNANANMHELYFNGTKVGEALHPNSSSFTFGNASIVLGQNRGSSTYRYSQFYGELHEVAVQAGFKGSFSRTNTLLPFYNKTLLYVDFEEADL